MANSSKNSVESLTVGELREIIGVEKVVDENSADDKLIKCNYDSETERRKHTADRCKQTDNDFINEQIYLTEMGFLKEKNKLLQELLRDKQLIIADQQTIISLQDEKIKGLEQKLHLLDSNMSNAADDVGSGHVVNEKSTKSKGVQTFNGPVGRSFGHNLVMEDSRHIPIRGSKTGLSGSTVLNRDILNQNICNKATTYSDVAGSAVAEVETPELCGVFEGVTNKSAQLGNSNVRVQTANASSRDGESKPSGYRKRGNANLVVGTGTSGTIRECRNWCICMYIGLRQTLVWVNWWNC